MIHDRDIREPLFDFLEETYGKCRIFEEKVIGSARADVMMVVPGEIWGIEIKSDADSYTRLFDQVREYDMFFDRNIVAVGSSHAIHVREHVPDYWGIISIEETDDEMKEKSGADGLDFYILRKAEKNPNMDMSHKMSLLWRPELAEIQERHGMPALKNLSKAAVRDRIIRDIDREELENDISFELFERDYSEIQDKINEYRTANGKKKRRRRKKIPNKKYRSGI